MKKWENLFHYDFSGKKKSWEKIKVIIIIILWDIIYY